MIFVDPSPWPIDLRTELLLNGDYFSCSSCKCLFFLSSFPSHSLAGVRPSGRRLWLCVRRRRRAPSSLDRIKARSSLTPGPTPSVRLSVKRRFLSHPIPTWKRRKSSGEGGTATAAAAAAGESGGDGGPQSTPLYRCGRASETVDSLSVPYLELEPEQFISSHTKKLSLSGILVASPRPS